MDTNSMDAKYIFKLIKKNKYITFIFIILSIIFSYLILSYEEKKNLLTFSVHPPQINQLMVLNILNNYILELNSGVNLEYFSKAKNSLISADSLSFSILSRAISDKNIVSVKTPLEDKIFIDEAYVINNFYNTLITEETFRDAITSFKESNDDFTNKEINEIQLESVFFEKSANSNQEVVKHIGVKISHPTNSNLLYSFYENFFIVANNSLTKDLFKLIFILENHYNSSIEEEIRDRELVNKEIYKNYENYIQREILLLKEQIEIAKSIGLEMPLQGINLNLSDDNNVNTGVNTSSYIFGSKTLEKTLKIYEKRENLNLYLPEYKINKDYISALKNDSKIETFKNFLNIHNIKLGYIETNRFNFGNLGSEVYLSIIQRGKITTYMVFIFISLILSLLTSLIRELFFSKK